MVPKNLKINNMENYKEKIANCIIYLDWNNDQDQEIDRIREAINYVWNNWDSDIIATYHEGGDKPENPTVDFIKNWVEDEDFEADGYDINYLKEIF